MNHNGSRKRKVLCIETGQVFVSLSAACRALQVDAATAHGGLKKRHRVNGYRFVYIDEVEMVNGELQYKKDHKVIDGLLNNKRITPYDKINKKSAK